MCRAEVKGGALFVWALLLYLDEYGIVPWAALAAGLHELGHYAALRVLGGRAVRFRLTAVGGELVLDPSRPLSYGRELAVVLAGPGVNLALAFLCARLAGGREVLYIFAGLNLALGCFNLLPLAPLDGGRALELLLTALIGPGRGGGLVLWLSRALAAALVLWGGAVLLRTGSNFTLLAVSVWLLAGLWQKSRSF